MKVDVIKYIKDNEDVSIKEMINLAEDILGLAFEFDRAEAEELFDADNYFTDKTLMPNFIIDMIKENRTQEAKHEIEKRGY